MATSQTVLVFKDLLGFEEHSSSILQNAPLLDLARFLFS